MPHRQGWTRQTAFRSPARHSGQRPGYAKAPPRLPAGVDVTLRGLRKRQDLNGLAAKVDSFLPDRGIYQVTVSTGEVVTVNPRTIEPPATADVDAPLQPAAPDDQ
eukprot:gene3163-610_t